MSCDATTCGERGHWAALYRVDIAQHTGWKVHLSGCKVSPIMLDRVKLAIVVTPSKQPPVSLYFMCNYMGHLSIYPIDLHDLEYFLFNMVGSSYSFIPFLPGYSEKLI